MNFKKHIFTLLLVLSLLLGTAFCLQACDGDEEDTSTITENSELSQPTLPSFPNIILPDEEL